MELEPDPSRFSGGDIKVGLYRGKLALCGGAYGHLLLFHGAAATKDARTAGCAGFPVDKVSVLVGCQGKDFAGIYLRISAGQNDGVKTGNDLFFKFFGIDFEICNDGDVHGFQTIYLRIQRLSGKFFRGNCIAECSAGLFLLLKNSHGISHPACIKGSRKSGRTGADHGNFFPVIRYAG